MDLFIISLGIGAGFVLISFFLGNIMEVGDVNTDGLEGVDGLESVEPPATVGAGLLAALRPVTVALFLTVFGATGIIAGNYGAPFLGAAGAGTILGLIFANLLYKYVIRPLNRAFNTSSSKQQELVGLPAKVALKIEKGGYGKIVYKNKGNTYSSPAVTEEEEVFYTGDTVYIKHIEGGKFFVGKRAIQVGQEESVAERLQ